jgi:hypothetical protein
VLEDLTGAHHVGAAVGQWHRVHVGADGGDPVLGRLPQRLAHQVQPDVAVAEFTHVRRQQAAAATEVHQHGAGPGRRRDQRGPGLGEPAQHDEGSIGTPPFGGERLVLAHVVAWQCHRHS